MTHTYRRMTPLLAITSTLLLVVFGGVVFHAPLTVWLGTVVPELTVYIKAWKEILLGIAAILLTIEVTRRERWSLFGAELWKITGAYVGLHVISVAMFWVNIESALAGLLIDGRFVVFVTLVYGVVSLEPTLRKWFITVFFSGAAVAMLFAVLQVTVLPHDILKYIGYSQETIAPFLTVDQNMDYVRINGTLRGPNPLGAYAVIILSLAGAGLYLMREKLSRRMKVGAGLLMAASAVALWVSYSRSALLALGAAVVVGLLAVYGKAVPRKLLVAASIGLLAASASLYVFHDTHFVSQVILHEDPSEGGAVNSNDGHAASLLDGLSLMIRQPLGAGVGSTGSASLLTDKPVIIENYYLFVAHETGWLGAALFGILFIYIIVIAWMRRKDWLAVGVLASGAGLACIGFVLPVWVDDTVALVWWGLAGVMLATTPVKKLKRRK